MASISAPVTGGSVSTNRGVFSNLKSVGFAAGGVMLMFIIFGLGQMMFNAAGDLPVIGRAAGGQPAIPVNRVAE